MEIGLVRRIDIDSEMQQSYLDYAMSVIVARALPDARDGLKPVHRRILYAMHSMGLRTESAFKKSARIVGEVLGKFHPHGDMAVYDAMARMAQDFSMRYPLIEGQGNFGSVDGDPPAAMRYTEARLGPLSMDLLTDIALDTVDFTENFDGSLAEPAVLPATAPNLLINGATGIAVGMATSIPPHNVGEVCDALIHMLENWSKLEQLTLDDLMKFIRGPDFPTGGILLQQEREGDGLRTAYATGRSRLSLLARAHMEEMSRGRSRIIVTELPFQTNKASLIQRVADLVRMGHLEGITDLRDESDRQGMRIVLELAKTADPEKVLAELCRRTPLQTTFSVILLALVDGEPRLLNLKSALRVYLEHRLEVVRRRSNYQLARARERAHILEGLRIAIKNLEAVIQMIRTAKDVEQAQARLQRRLDLSQAQARAILDMRLRRLSSLERKKIDQEYRETVAQIKALEALLRSPKKMRSAVAKELVAIKSRYADRRRTQIVASKPGQKTAALLTAVDLAPDKPTWVVITPKGLISRTPTARPPRLSGRRSPLLVLAANLRDTLYLFNAQGSAAACAVHTLPECSNPDQGAPFHAATALPADVPIVAGVALSAEMVGEASKGGYLLTITAAGMVKKSSLRELPGPSATSFQAVKIGEQDRLAWVRISSGQDEILLVSSSGYAIRFAEQEIRPMGLAAAGVLGIRFDRPEAELTGADILQPGADLIILGHDGRAKRTALSQFPKQGRYGKGVIIWKSGDEVQIVGAAVGRPDGRATAVLARAANRTVRYGDVARRVRTSSGPLLFQVKEDDRVVSLRPLIPRPSFAKKPRAQRPKRKAPTKTKSKAPKKGTKQKAAKPTKQGSVKKK
jgi:DNA gyrase subunit A